MKKYWKIENILESQSEKVGILVIHVFQFEFLQDAGKAKGKQGGVMSFFANQGMYFTLKVVIYNIVNCIDYPMCRDIL